MLEAIELERATPRRRIELALEEAGGSAVLTTSFGIQSAALLHMVTQLAPDIPVVFINTGFLFDETLRFADELTERLNLNVKIYTPGQTADELIREHGMLWNDGVDGLARYNQIVKVQPMQVALEELRPTVWISGLRRSQSRSRLRRQVIEREAEVTKYHPLVDWSGRDIFLYLRKHGLPYHPLWDQGYLSVGDWHSSAPLQAGRDEESTRFGGLKRECGLHEKFSK